MGINTAKCIIVGDKNKERGAWMTATYRLAADQVSTQLLDSIRAAFGNKEIELIVHTLDDTDYLLGTKANREHLSEALKRSSEGENVVTVDIKEFD